jgi:hypothetical protein
MIGGKRLTVIEQFVLYRQQYIRPPMTFTTVPAKPRKADRSVAARGYGANAGRTNGMPWDGTSPCSAGADPMAKPEPKDLVGRQSDSTPIWAWDLPRLWEMAQNPWVKMSWRDVAVQLDAAASVMADQEFAAELRLLGDIALIHYYGE